MRDVIDCPVLDSVSIDPKTAYPHLVVSEDRTSVQWNNKQKKVPKNPERFMCAPAALGSEGFTSGRHYWEVEVGDSSIWSLGVARESVERRTPVETSSVNGFYLLYKTLGYAVLCPTRKRLHLPVKPRRIGVYLDYEGGQVSLYNAEDMSHIYTYTDIFTEKMYPYFDTRYNLVPLKVIQTDS
nr:PREDICTED: zinc-binding protein A33-like [Latimeria chalumnae]|eukprot:XP_014345210.1 PREDICTED: zinc-binding protein A33-like [Latimeria chalumnae]